MERCFQPMRSKCLFHFVAVGFAVVATSPAGAAFHLIQIEQVIGGVNGDTTAQAVQLRTRVMSTETVMSAAKLWVRDAAGENPILLIDFMSDVANGELGARILIASENFLNYLDPSITPDFTMTSLIPESYLAAGTLTFEDNAGNLIVWRLCWGGDNYTGPTDASTFNDADGDVAPPWTGSLPADGLQAVQFQGAAGDLSTTNADDYALTKGAAVFTNNAGDSATVTAPPVCPWDLDGRSSVGILDLLALLAVWGTDPGGPPDFDGDGTVGILDLLTLLANWGPCP